MHPQQPLAELLEDYTVLDSKPLHDLKGHFLHLFAELLYLLEGEDILASHKDTTTGAKCRDTVSFEAISIRSYPAFD